MIKASALKPMMETNTVLQKPISETSTISQRPETESVVQISTSSHFQNMKIVLQNERPYPSVVKDMATKMMDIYDDIEGALHIIYKAYEQEDQKFVIPMLGKNSAQRQIVLDWMEDMKAVIGEYFYDRKTNCIIGSVEDVPRARKFLIGGFLEIAIAKQTQKIVSELADKYQQPFEVQTNVVVSAKDSMAPQNEFDVVIMFGKILYVIEIKSGKSFRDYSKYYSVGRRYGIVPNRILLVDSCLKEWEADMAEYFAEYYVATIHSFEEKLIRMLSQDMEVKKNA